MKKDKATILSDEDVMECMRTFCNDNQIDINTRLAILEKLKKIIKTMSDDDLMLLLVYKTNAILANCDFFDRKVELIDSKLIESPEKRSELILEWINYAKTRQEYSAILNLIRVWPKFAHDSPLFAYLTKLAINTTEILVILDSVLEQHENSGLNLSVKELEELETMLKNEASEKWTNRKDETLKRNFIKICLAFKSRENSEFVASYLKSLDLECLDLMDTMEVDDLEANESYESLVNDNELASLLLRDKFYCEIVNTKLYTVFLHNLLSNKSKSELLEVVRALKENELSVEAANLYALIENFFPSYKNLSVSLSLLNRFS